MTARSDYAGIDFAAIEARIARELPSRGAWLREAIEPEPRDALDVGEPDDDASMFFDVLASPFEHVAEFEVRSIESLAVDEAFLEPIKEGPFDLDPHFTRASLLEAEFSDDPELDAIGEVTVRAPL